jgi:regulator of protease activity HflC (stomatin/prohibitin superfamily)
MKFDTPKEILTAISIGLCGILCLIILCGSFYTVDSGEKAILITNGKISGTEGDGLHLKLPFIQSITKVDIRTQIDSVNAASGTRDQQQVSVNAIVNYHLDPNRLSYIYKRTGIDIQYKIVEPISLDAIKSVTAKYTAEDQMAKRDVIRNEIIDVLRKRLAWYDVVLEGVQITNFQYSNDYDKAIEKKQTAQQNALTARYSADAETTAARGKATAIKIQSEAVREQGGHEYVVLQAIEAWKQGGAKLPTIIGGGAPIPFIGDALK